VPRVGAFRNGSFFLCGFLFLLTWCVGSDNIRYLGNNSFSGALPGAALSTLINLKEL
jgi:hypothetical protein